MGYKPSAPFLRFSREKRLTAQLSPNRKYIILASIIAVYVLLAAQLSLSIPLGEAPDEPAQFQYISYIVDYQSLPGTQTERKIAGYRADKSPLYHLGAAMLARVFHTDGVQSLKLIGENPRRLLPADGNPPYAILHTDDELPPYSGVVRRWHAARFISLWWGMLALLLLYRLLAKEFSAGWALFGMALVAATPRYLQMSAVLNEDTLLAFLVILYLNLLQPIFHRRGGWRRYAALGLVAGLALTAKYSALFLSLDVVLVWFLFRQKPTAPKIAAYIGGVTVGMGWWFAFVVYHFNQIDSLGWLKGSLAPFLLGGSDAASHKVAASLGMGNATGGLNVFLLDWLDWWRQLFVSFWFAADNVPVGWWVPLAIACAVAGGWLIWQFSHNRVSRRLTLFVAGHLLLFVPLPLVRYVLTQNIAETAQGRHLLFPAIFSLAIFGVLALGGNRIQPSRRQVFAVAAVVAFLLLEYATFDFPRVTLADIPPLPVRTTDNFSPPTVVLDTSIAGQRLVGVDFPVLPPSDAVYPLTLRWYAENPAETDFFTRITLLDSGGNSVGLWQGMPVNGRYPPRAWEVGDTIFDTIPVPMLAGGNPVSARLDVLTENGAEIASVSFPVSSFSPQPSSIQTALLPRGDRLPATAPYRFRSTIAVRTAGKNAKISLRNPSGDEILPIETIGGEKDSIALFWVDWTWQAGQYTVQIASADSGVHDVPAPVTVQTNRRLITPPPVSHPLNANFADRFLLVGYDFSARTVEPGASFDVTLVWQSLAETTDDFAVFNHLLNVETQTQFGGRDRIPKNFYRTILWQTGEFVVDTYPVPVQFDAPPGIYWLDVGLYPAENPAAQPLSLVADGKILPQNSVRLGAVKVGGQPAISLPPKRPAHPADIRFGDAIRLTGYTLEPENDSLKMQLFWNALATPTADFTVFVHVLDESGAVVTQNDAPPVNGLYPTGFWAAGETIFDPHAVSLADVPAGKYTIRIGLYNPQTGARLSVIGQPNGAVDLATFSHLGK